MSAASGASLWRCPRCGRGFANRNQTHTCGLAGIESHFAGKSAEVRAIYDALVKLVERCGPVTVLPEKTRIAFQVRMSFAAVSVRKNHLVGHFVFARRLEDPRFLRVETYSPKNHLHAFRIDRLEDLDAEFESWAREAYAVGCQEHLSASRTNPRRHPR